MQKQEVIRKFLNKYLSSLEYSAGGGFTPELPDYDFYAYDYLNFAEKNLRDYDNFSDKRAKSERLIACVSNLKRALECQIDTVLTAFNIKKSFDEKNLGLSRKLEFLKHAGIFQSRSIERLVNIRNRIEHQYTNPSIHDLEILFDLVSSFVAILSNIFVLTSLIETELYIDDPNNPVSYKVLFLLKYDRDKTKFTIKIKNTYDESENFELSCTIDEYEEFAFFFKVAYLLHLRQTFASDELILEKLN